MERFAEIAAAQAVDLGAAALAIGAGAEPGLDLRPWLDELDRLAVGVDGVEGLVRRLFVERGFAGDRDDYHDPQNSLLHRVLDRRVGIPVSLAVVVLEVGRRAGVALEGVGMPGHFLVRDLATGALLDPFHGGRRLDDAAAEELFRRTTGAGAEVAFGPRLLPAVGTHQILDRMLANLAGAYRNQGAAGEVEWVLRMRLALPTAGDAVTVELGEALASRGRYREGAQEVEARAGGDARLLAAARALRARLN